MGKNKCIFNDLDLLIIISYLVAFLVGFIYPVFFYSNEMFFPTYVPSEGQLGSDLFETFTQTKNPSLVLYSPLAKVLFALFSLIPFTIAYKIQTVLSIILLILLCYKILPRIADRRNFYISTFFLITILASYGFQFELQRGQWNLITIFLIFYSLLLFKNGNKNASILFFSLAVHLKVFPLIFVLMFFNNNSSWEQNIIHYIKILIFNCILLFILGWDSFIIYFKGLMNFAGEPFLWIGNHSIAAFVYKFSSQFHNIKYLTQILFLIYLICLLIVILISSKNKLPFYNKYLLFLLIVGALIIPTVSHDYTIPFINLALMFYIFNTNRKVDLKEGILLLFLILFNFLMYFSYTNYVGIFEYFFKNKFLLIFTSGLIVTLMCIRDYFLIQKPDENILKT